MNDNETADAFTALIKRICEEQGLNTLTLDFRWHAGFTAYAHWGAGRCEQGIGDTPQEAIRNAVEKMRAPLPFAEAA